MAESVPTGNGDELDVLIARFLEAVERGESLNREQWIEDHPAHQSSLRAFFADLDRLDKKSDVDETKDFKATAPPLKKIGNYTLAKRIGSGGMGEVWVAEQSKPVRRRVALKLIKAGMDSKAIIARFEVERQALAAIDHPNVAKILDGGSTNTGHPYFVMELVNGAPLTQFCDEAKLSVSERLELMVQISSAVQHAHHKGIVHRDLKPANILVTVIDGKPVPKIIDFGLAKALGGKLTDESFVTSFGTVMGTIEYMAPEQAGFSGQDVDTRADVYSLGVILYELLTGLLPFDSARLRKAAVDEMLRIIREEDPIRPSTRLSSSLSAPSSAAVRRSEPKQLTGLLRSELDWIVMKSLEKDRNRRYETAGLMAREIGRFLANEPIEARPPTPFYRVRKFAFRHKVTAAWIATVTILLITATIVSAIFAVQASLAREREAKANQEKIAAVEARLEQELATQKATENARISRDREQTAAFFSRLTRARTHLDSKTAGWKQKARQEIEAAEQVTQLATVHHSEIRSLKASTEVRDDLSAARSLFEQPHVNRVEFHPSGDFLIAATGRASAVDWYAHILVYDLRADRLVQTLDFADSLLIRPSQNGIRSMQFNQSGDVFAFASNSGKIYFHRFRNGRMEKKPYKRIELADGLKVNQLLSYSDHEFIICHRADSFPYYISRISDTGGMEKTTELTGNRGYGIFNVDPKTRQITLYSEGTIFRLDGDTLETTSTSNVPGIAFPLNRELVVRSDDSGGHLFSIEHGIPICRIHFEDAIRGFSKNRIAAVSNDQTKICIVSPEKNELVLVSASDLKTQAISALGTSTTKPIDVKISPDNQLIAVATYDDVRIYEVNTSSVSSRTPGEGAIRSFATPIIKDQPTATWYGYSDGKFGAVEATIDGKSRKVFMELAPQVNHPLIAVSSGKLIYTSDFGGEGDAGYGKINISKEGGAQLSFAVHKPRDLAKSYDETLYISSEGKIIEIELENANEINRYSHVNESILGGDLDYHRLCVLDSDRLVAGSQKGTLHLFDISKRKLVLVEERMIGSQPITLIEYDSLAEAIYVGNLVGDLVVVDAKTFATIREHKDLHGSGLSGLAVVGENQIVTSGKDGFLRLWQNEQQGTLSLLAEVQLSSSILKLYFDSAANRLHFCLENATCVQSITLDELFER